MRMAFFVNLLASMLILSAPALPVSAQPATDLGTGRDADRIVVGDPEHRFDSDSARGSWLAIHFLPALGSPQSKSLVKEYTDGAATIAGLSCIFVTAESAESFRTAAAALADGGAAAYRDSDGSLARRFSIGTTLTAPVLLVVDPVRHELFQHSGKSASDHLAFSEFAGKLAAATQDKESREANLESHLALAGYDPVAYLDEKAATAGDKRIESTFRGITYRFASAANRSKFNAGPTRYLPAYGGWCATAMAKGDKVEVDPKNFKVTNGRVFLFYKGFFGNAINDWNKDEPGLTVKADSHWKTVVSDK